MARFILTAALRGRCYYFTHFTDEQTKEQQCYLMSFLEVSQLAVSVAPEPTLFATRMNCGQADDAGSLHSEMTLTIGELGLGSSFSPMATPCVTLGTPYNLSQPQFAHP